MGSGQSYPCGNTCKPLTSDTIFDYPFLNIGNVVQNPGPTIISPSPNSCGQVESNMNGRECVSTTIELVCLLEQADKPDEIDACPGAFFSVSDFEETSLTEGLEDSKDEYVVQDYVFLDMTGVKKFNCDYDYPCTFARGYDDEVACPFFVVDASEELKIKNARFYDFRPDEFFDNIKDLLTGTLDDDGSFLFSDQPSQFACVNDLISDQGVFDYVEIEGLKFPKASKSSGRRGLGQINEGGKKKNSSKKLGKSGMTDAQRVEAKERILALEEKASTTATAEKNGFRGSCVESYRSVQ
mmetsp:Transcript_94297/g.141287  ORF Transcript_94297/g.141287 Transcript_94297/m.141287 type:complete len:297 (-) Transcript_94297:349-1239(-)